MPTRIPGGGVAKKNPYGTTWVHSERPPETLEDQVEERLFGQSPPPLLDEDDAVIDRLLARLMAYKRKLAIMVGDKPDDYELLLALSRTMSIDRTGIIYVGKEFLLATADQFDVQVGALAHEIGHRPRRWDAYRRQKPRTASELNDLCRLEETRADFFAGYALAQLGFNVEPLCAYLARVEGGPHPAYFTAGLRAKTLREGYRVGARRKHNLEKFYPELARVSNVASDLGEG